MTLKRSFDLVVGLTLVIPAAPIMALVAIAVRLTSGTPVLHRAVRSGRHGKPFVMYKFRTMAVVPDGSALTGPDDPRVTKVGGLLRQTRLDELPQLLNVIRGDMSLVGPRPEDPRFVAAYTEEQRQVLTLRPGVTSPAAIAYRNEAASLPPEPAARDAHYAQVLLPEKLALDLDYLRTRSFRGDLRVLAQTVAAVLRKDGDAIADESAPEGLRILLLGELDGFANGVRMREVARYLRALGHRVVLEDTGRLSRASRKAGSVWSMLPRPTPLRLMLYCVEAWGFLVRRSARAERFLSYRQIRAELRLRRSVLAAALEVSSYDLVACVTPHDASYVAAVTTVPTWYDCPTPWADELLYEGRLTERQHRRMRDYERRLFEEVDFLSFHWHSYAAYVRDEYALSREDVLRADWGCRPGPVRAEPSESPRVAYLGSLSSRFIDLPLLARLHRTRPCIDVFGGPSPDPSLGLTYLGHATPDVLAGYQFGIVTCTKDPLRRRGFSAKHLEYLAAGLPVLVPDWREHHLAGTLSYNEETFADVVAGAGRPERWVELSSAALRQAEDLRWECTLKGLDPMLAALAHRASRA